MPNYGSQAADSHGWSLGGVCVCVGQIQYHSLPKQDTVSLQGFGILATSEGWQGADARLAVSFDIFQGGGDSDNYHSLASPFGQR